MLLIRAAQRAEDSQGGMSWLFVVADRKENGGAAIRSRRLRRARGSSNGRHSRTPDAIAHSKHRGESGRTARRRREAVADGELEAPPAPQRAASRGSVARRAEAKLKSPPSHGIIRHDGALAEERPPGSTRRRRRRRITSTRKTRRGAAQKTPTQGGRRAYVQHYCCCRARRRTTTNRIGRSSC